MGKKLGGGGGGGGVKGKAGTGTIHSKRDNLKRNQGSIHLFKSDHF